ncbi:PhoP regulatory network YrbL family protein [Alkalimarinus alittae]|uniref:PhoP regulatory network YrbL family protein n=1 Tax=Alkalimarinus alittae TaxID=2961619 RepID=A0ABY6N151_9ALTE|nr:PhoP regulatory network YrbL family protein [Alkalimarinus alittae]UZE95760.1 PhoP regulatory network YrbL family protein [Alkalimarinus alittae]
MTLLLKSTKPFAQGGNRLCFVHPNDLNRCIKVRRPDFTLEDLRRRKGFPKNMKPLSSFDDNAEEYRVMRGLYKRFGNLLHEHVSGCFGFEETDMGKGLVSDLIRDDNQRVSHTLKQYIWDNGYTGDCRRAVDRFCSYWESLCVPSRDLLLHNIVAQRNAEGSIVRLVVIDGLGSSSLFPAWMLPPIFFKKKAKRKTENLRQRIELLLTEREKGGGFPGYYGLLMHDGTSSGRAQK